MATVTCGTGARDYTTLAGLSSYLDGLNTFSSPEIVEFYNDGTLSGTLDLTGFVTDSTNTLTLRCAAGQSHKDYASKRAKPRRCDQTYGVMIDFSAGFGFAINANAIGYVTIDGLQLKGSTTFCGAYNGTATTNVIRDCIIESQRGTYSFVAGKSINSLFISLDTYATPFLYPQGGSNTAIHGCTYVLPDDLDGSGVTMVTTSYGSVDIVNTAIFGAATSTSGTTSATNCMTDDASPDAGFTTVAYADQFVDNVSATRDFRLKPTSDLIGAGTEDTGYESDSFGNARPQCGSWDIGAEEWVRPFANGYSDTFNGIGNGTSVNGRTPANDAGGLGDTTGLTWSGTSAVGDSSGNEITVGRISLPIAGNIKIEARAKLVTAGNKMFLANRSSSGDVPSTSGYFGYASETNLYIRKYDGTHVSSAAFAASLSVSTYYDFVLENVGGVYTFSVYETGGKLLGTVSYDNGSTVAENGYIAIGNFSGTDNALTVQTVKVYLPNDVWTFTEGFTDDFTGTNGDEVYTRTGWGIIGTGGGGVALVNASNQVKITAVGNMALTGQVLGSAAHFCEARLYSNAVESKVIAALSLRGSTRSDSLTISYDDFSSLWRMRTAGGGSVITWAGAAPDGEVYTAGMDANHIFRFYKDGAIVHTEDLSWLGSSYLTNTGVGFWAAFSAGACDPLMDHWRSGTVSDFVEASTAAPAFQSSPFQPDAFQIYVVLPNGQTVAIGITTETDSAFSFSHAKAKAMGLATETDSALAATKRKAYAAGLVSETDSSFALTYSKAKAIGISSETDSSFALSHSKAKAMGLASETDSALTATRVKSKAVGLTTETDSAFAFLHSWLRAIGQAQESDSALSYTHSWLRAIGLASETDSALAATVRRTKAIGLATETDQAFDFTRPAAGVLGIAYESDEALNMTARKVYAALGIASEADSALAARAVKSKTAGISTETDSALAATRNKSKTLGLGTEADSALAFAKLKTKAMGLASETDSGLVATGLKTKAVGLSTETDSARPVTYAKAKTIGLASETDAALVATVLRSYGIGLPVESDEALPATARRSRIAGIASETSSAFPFDYARAATLGISEESDEAVSFGRARAYTIGIAEEFDTALPEARNSIVDWFVDGIVVVPLDMAATWLPIEISPAWLDGATTGVSWTE